MSKSANKRNDNTVLKERLEIFYKCRDLEITNLWQRSVFLGAFLLLCFTGYGYILFSYEKCCYDIDVNMCGALLSIVGQVMSVIWILMGKGSKRWYEVYEKVICDIEHHAKLEIPENYRMGEYCDISKTCESIFSLSAGKFSPSKLNICIGHVSLYIWGMIFCMHVGNMLREHFACLGRCSFVIAIFFAFMVASILVIALKKSSQSSC